MAKNMKTALVNAGVVSAETAAPNDPTAVNGGAEKQHERRESVLWSEVSLFKHGTNGDGTHRFDEVHGEEKRQAFLHYFRKPVTIGGVLELRDLGMDKLRISQGVGFRQFGGGG